MRCIDFGVADAALVVQQRLDDFAAAPGGKTPVGAEAHQQEFGGGAGQRTRQVTAMRTRRVEVVERTGDQQVGVGVEVFAEFVALVAQVALDLELDVLGAVLQLQAFTQLGPNFSFITSSLRYVMWPIMRAMRRPRFGTTPWR